MYNISDLQSPHRSSAKVLYSPVREQSSPARQECSSHLKFVVVTMMSDDDDVFQSKVVYVPYEGVLAEIIPDSARCIEVEGRDWTLIGQDGAEASMAVELQEQQQVLDYIKSHSHKLPNLASTEKQIVASMVIDNHR